jgi:ADP-ribose pyrophosphatase
MEDGRYPNLPRVAVGAVVFHNGRVLLVRRSTAPARGQWAIPGGRIELGERLQEAAEREVLEETGIVIRAKEPIYAFDLLERDETGGIVYHYVIVDLAGEFVSGEPAAGDDGLEARWISKEESLKLEINPETRRLLSDRYGFPG